MKDIEEKFNNQINKCNAELDILAYNQEKPELICSLRRIIQNVFSLHNFIKKREEIEITKKSKIIDP
jgi:hypothetical protein